MTTAPPPSPPAPPPPARSELWSWIRVVGAAVAFAVVLRACAVEAYRIPSTSMEGTLLVGDYVLVSKVQYGALVAGWRAPGLGRVERGDVVVFHYPPGLESPIRKREPYIKRVVGLPGDTVAIDGKQLRVGRETVPLPDAGRQLWEVVREGAVTIDTLRAIGLDGRVERTGRGTWRVDATAAQARQLAEVAGVLDVRPLVRPRGDGSAPFPLAARYSLDEYGPVAVPAAGQTVALDDETWPVIRGVVERFEGRTAARTADGFLIDDRPAETYTFAQDYYFVLGDNRDDSADSRAWGFVPADHLIGKAVGVYFSWDEAEGAVRWARVGRPVR